MNVLKFTLSQKRHWFLFAAALTLDFTLFAIPSQAATINNSSLLSIALDNFNQIPNTLGLEKKIKTTTVADIGVVESDFNIDSQFSAEPSVFAFSNIQSTVSGTGSVYSAKTSIASTLLGGFSVAAGESLRFNFSALLALENSTDSFLDGSASTFGGLNLFLQDGLTRSNLFKLSVGVNTNPVGKLAQDIFQAQLSPNITLTGFNQSTVLGGMDESVQIFVSGTFEQYFAQDTQVILGIATKSCNYGSNIVDVCQKVPEPDNQFALLLGIIGYVGYLGFSRIMK
jgi:hypothetical protein